MDISERIERALLAVLAHAVTDRCPPRLGAAMHYAVFPGGARVRPKLCLAVAAACGDDVPQLTDTAACAIELLHCASLVHDDLPCFDDAALRRGKPSVHRTYGERLAVLSGDALIVLAFEALARAGQIAPARLPALLAVIGRGVGGPAGIVAGQAWECESHVNLVEYQRAKTGALFAAATEAGAAAAGADPRPWRAFGEQLGEAYQVADDIRDVVADTALLGKPAGRDAALGRPSAAGELGLAGALDRFEALLVGAADALPECPGASMLLKLLRLEAMRLLPGQLARDAMRVGTRIAA